MITIKECPECEERHDLTWVVHVVPTPSAPMNGSMGLHDVQAAAYLACGACSATVMSLNDDEIVQYLNEITQVTG